MASKKTLRNQQRKKRRFIKVVENLADAECTIKVKKVPIRFGNLELDEQLVAAINRAYKQGKPLLWEEKKQRGILVKAYLTDIKEIWATFKIFKPKSPGGI